MEQQVTIRDVFVRTAEILEGIKVPCGLIDEIGLPVRAAITNIRECIRAFDANAQKQPEEPEEPEETEQGGE